MQFVKSKSQTLVETDVENTESDIADEKYDYESDNLSVAIDSSDNSEQYIFLSKDRKYNWVNIIPETRTEELGLKI